eukprot:COSAG05_NODE_365_length_10774_cov_121.347822_9_plen_572_part_00
MSLRGSLISLVSITTSLWLSAWAQPLNPVSGTASTCDLSTLDNRIDTLNTACCSLGACYTSNDECSVDCAIVLLPLLADCRTTLDAAYDANDGVEDGVASIFDDTTIACLSIPSAQALLRVQELYDTGACSAESLNGVGETSVTSECVDTNPSCELLISSGIACAILLGACDATCNFCGAGHRRYERRRTQANNLKCDVTTLADDIANINTICCDTDGACAAGVPNTCDAKCAVFFVGFYNRCDDYINLQSSPTHITALQKLATTCETSLPTRELLMVAASCSNSATIIYAVGGYDGNIYLTTAERYDPDTNSWTPIASMDTRRDGLGLTTLNNNLYAVGGSDSDGITLTTAERYDPDLDSWTPIASMGTTRYALSLTTLNNNLYAGGGKDETYNTLSSSERYDPDTNSWTPIASMGTRREYLGLTTLNNNLYAVGGLDGDNYLNTAERYDPDLNSWTPIASMGTRRRSLGLTAFNNNLYAVGGQDNSGNTLSTAERYDPDTNSWTPIASMGTTRSGLGLTALNNYLYAVGGRDENYNYLTTAERYDPDSNSWTPIASMGTARDHLGLTAL